MTITPDLTVSATSDPYGRVAGFYDLLHIGPGSAELVAFFVETASLAETAGLETAGPRTAGLETAGPGTAGLETAGPGTAGLETAGDGVHALEIGPGTGRMTLPVAGRVASLHCLERSAAMRTVLLTKLAAHPTLRDRVTVLDAAVPDVRLDRLFGYVYLAAVLEHVPPAARRPFFASLAERLAPGGILATDMVHDEPLPDLPEHVVREAHQGECRYTLSTAVRPLGRDLADVRHVYRVYHRDDLVGTEIVDRRHHVHRPADVLADLRAVGLEGIGGSAVAGPDAPLAGKGTLVARRAAPP